MNPKIRSAIYLIPLAVILLSPLVGCGDRTAEAGWPRWRGPGRDGISTETDWDPTALAGGPKTVWHIDIGFGHSSIAVKDGRIYTMGQQSGESVVLCLKAETGEEIWRQSFGEINEPLATPTVDGDRVYVLSKSGVVCCLKSKNGDIRWKKDLVQDFGSPKAHYGYAGSPLIEGGLVILNARTSGIALNKKTGEKIWEGEVHTDEAGDYFSTPVIYDYADRRYTLLFSDSGLFSMDVESGSKLWFYEWAGGASPHVADPVVFENKVFVSSGEANPNCVLLDIDGNKPRVIWLTETMRNHVSTCIYLDGYLYGCDGDVDAGERNQLRCIDAETGDMTWETEMIAASLMAADGKLIIIEGNGTLHLAEVTPSQYTEISSCELTSITGINRWWTPPILYKAKIYCRNYAGDLVCIDVSK